MTQLPLLTLADVARNLTDHGLTARLINPLIGAKTAQTQVAGVSIDSRQIKGGELFICKGSTFKPSYLTDAISAGAAAYLCGQERANELAQTAPGVPALVVDDVRRAMAYVSAQVYGHPDKRLTIFGVTGTKGKSTVTYMLKAILEANGCTPSIVGSIENDDGVERFESHNTTPEAPDLWRHLYNTERAGRDTMIAEVSSQALRYDRTLGLSLSIACFLNIGRDHISPFEHEDFEDYFASKLSIFAQSNAAVINLNSTHADKVVQAARQSDSVTTFGVNRPDAHFCATNLQSRTGRVDFILTERQEGQNKPASTIPISLGMAGLFNVENALAAIAMARKAGVGFAAIVAGLESVHVPGHMELLFSPDHSIVAIVDYAHNRLSFETLFRSVRAEYLGRKVISVFGVVGDKAQERRRELPEVAGAYSDLMIFTENDPGHERVEDICAELALNAPADTPYEIICDREAAIARALEVAAAEAPAVVLLLTRGPRTYQHRGDDYLAVRSDLEIAREVLLSLDAVTQSSTPQACVHKASMSGQPQPTESQTRGMLSLNEPQSTAPERHVVTELPYPTLNDLVRTLTNHGIAVRMIGTHKENDISAIHIRGASIDSRQVDEGMLFICKGAAFRSSYLTDAVSAGAVAYLCGRELADELTQTAPGVPALVVDDVRQAMAYVSAQVYGHPDEQLTIFGVTGTKGKSTVTYMLKSIFEADGRRPSILGSIDTDDGVEHFESHNTTPEAPDLWRHLSNTVRAGRETMIMEVSSQALHYDRTLGLSLTVGCFLNIGRDHISPLEHENFEDYFDSKLKIFEQSKIAVINLNSELEQRVADAAQQSEHVITFGVNRPEAHYCASNLHAQIGRVEFDLTERHERESGEASNPTTIRINLGMAGLFNVNNALAAIAMARVAGISFSSIAAGLEHLRVPGRMEVVSSPDGNIMAIVDYAHNQLSFETLFRSVKTEYPDRRIISVFGAPGNKAPERRRELPQIAGTYSDLMIFTEEDPAYERVEDICAELARNAPEGAAFKIICDREEAIRRAVDEATQEPSVVLLLAKGAETRQHRGDEYPAVKSDLEIARELLLK